MCTRIGMYVWSTRIGIDTMMTIMYTVTESNAGSCLAGIIIYIGMKNLSMFTTIGQIYIIDTIKIQGLGRMNATQHI